VHDVDDHSLLIGCHSKNFLTIRISFFSCHHSSGELGAGRSTPAGSVKLQRNITLTGAGPALGGNPTKPAAKYTTSGTGGDGAGGRDTFSELSRFHKAQVRSFFFSAYSTNIFFCGLFHCFDIFRTKHCKWPVRKPFATNWRRSASTATPFPSKA